MQQQCLGLYSTTPSCLGKNHVDGIGDDENQGEREEKVNRGNLVLFATCLTACDYGDDADGDVEKDDQHGADHDGDDESDDDRGDVEVVVEILHD